VEDHFVVQRSAVERMGVTDHGGVLGFGDAFV